MTRTSHTPRIQRATRSFLDRLQVCRGRALSASDLAQPAIVFAPHQDDETLGCGGTIIKKLSAHADVAVAFLSDGGASHRTLMGSSELSSLRHREAVSAAQVLGVNQESIYFFDAPDGQLHEHMDDLSARIKSVLATREPQQVFVPFRFDRLPDHVATHQIVIDAIASINRATAIYEYPIWFWDYWPQMRRAGTGIRRIPSEIGNSLKSVFTALLRFGSYVNVSDIIAQKWAALECHQTQMTRLNDRPEWGTLSDVADGDFLKVLMSDLEFFYSWKLRDQTGIAKRGTLFRKPHT